jgi:hypothetical protein
MMKQKLIELCRSLGGRTERQFHWLRNVKPGHSAAEVADALIRAAGELEIAETRVW